MKKLRKMKESKKKKKKNKLRQPAFFKKNQSLNEFKVLFVFHNLNQIHSFLFCLKIANYSKFCCLFKISFIKK